MVKDKFYQEFDIGKYSSMLHRYGRWFMNGKMSEYRIGPGQYIYLFFLYSNDGCFTQDEISKALDIDKGTTARALKKLEEENYILRKMDDYDKRKNRVFLTEKAMGLKDIMSEFSKEWTEILLEGFEIEEMKIFSKMVDRVLDNASGLKKSKCEHCKRSNL